MTPEKRALKKEHDEARAKPPSLLGIFKPKSAEEHETKTIWEEKKRKRRIVKMGEKAMRHGSEAFEEHRMTQEDLKITEQVMEGVSPSAPAPVPARKEDAVFPCFQCGAPVPESADRCPKCRALYIKDFSEDELEKVGNDIDETQLNHEVEEFLTSGNVPCMHFDPESGTISYLEEDDKEPEYSLECSHCGTEVLFDADRCPICGTKLNVVDTGIVSLFSGMKFADEDCKETDCPQCGEHVTLVDGKCPACGEVVCTKGQVEVVEKLDPVIHTNNVVFVHLNVQSGELNYLQKMAKKLGLEQVTVQLDGIGRAGFDREWASLSRI